MSNHLSLQQDPSRWGKGQSAATQFCFHSQKLVFDLPPSHLSYEPGCCSSQPSALRSPPPSPGAAPGRGSPPSLVQQTPTERREHSDASAEPGCPVEGQFLSRPPAERAGQEGAFLPALLPVTMPANQLCGGFTSKLNFHILQHCAYLQNLLSQHTHTQSCIPCLAGPKECAILSFFCPSFWEEGRLCNRCAAWELVQPLEPRPQGRAALPTGCSHGLRALLSQWEAMNGRPTNNYSLSLPAFQSRC